MYRYHNGSVHYNRNLKETVLRQLYENTTLRLGWFKTNGLNLCENNVLDCFDFDIRMKSLKRE